jgi:hypothetical protein
MLRPEEEEEEKGLYDDVGANLKPPTAEEGSQFPLKNTLTSKVYDNETLITGNFADTEYIDLAKKLNVP